MDEDEDFDFEARGREVALRLAKGKVPTHVLPF